MEENCYILLPLLLYCYSEILLLPVFARTLVCEKEIIRSDLSVCLPFARFRLISC